MRADRQMVRDVRAAAIAGLAALMFSAAAPLRAQNAPPPVRDPRQPPAAQLPPRDRQPTPAVGTGVVSGRVIDAVTGRAVARARVRLQGGGQPRPPVLSDESGAFSFDQLPPGMYSVSVEKSGYLPGRYPDPGRSLRNRSQMLPLTNGQTRDDLTVSMFRGGVIAGRVVDTYGDPVEGANVSVLMMPKNGRPSMRNSTQTNDLGEFRVTRLGAGRYILRVRPPNQGQYYLNPASNEPPLPQPLPAYYPATQSLDQAQPIVLNRGETVTGADVVLEEGLPSVVTGMVLGLDAPQPKAAGPPANINGSVSARAAGSVEGWIETGTGIRPDGTFRFPLAPGEYILEARVSPSRPGAQPRPEDELYGSVRITVGSGPLENVAIALGAGAVATGRVIFEGSTPPPRSPGQARVPLVNSESAPGCRPPMATINEDWSFRVEGLVGTCSMQPGGAIGRWSVKSVMFRDRNLADASITFEPGQQYSNVQIIVTDKRTQVDVRVTDEAGQPTRDFVALVFPADKAKWSQIVRHLRTIVPPSVMTPNLLTPPGGVNFTMQTGIIQGGTIVPGGLGISQGSVVGLNGASRLSGMQPGDYFAIALDDIDPEDMQDPDVLEKLTTSAVRFTVGYDAPAEVPLRRWTLAEIIR